MAAARTGGFPVSCKIMEDYNSDTQYTQDLWGRQTPLHKKIPPCSGKQVYNKKYTAVT